MAVIEAASLVTYLILLGRVLDHVFGTSPSRIVAGVLAAPVLFLAYGASLPTDVIEHPPSVQDAAADAAQGEVVASSSAAGTTAPAEWYRAAAARLAAMPDDGPVIFVAASGGGSRAAIFAALVLETMSLPPASIQIPGGGDSARTPSWKRPLVDYVFAVSSVSGGSVAAAQFAAATSDVPWSPDADAATHLQWPSVLDAAESGLEAGPARTIAHEVLARHAVLRPLLVNFNAVAVRGFLAPFDTRGRALADFWEDHFDWTGRVRGGTPGKVPLLLINATLVESGRGLVVGVPTVPQELFTEGSRNGVLALAPAPADRITRVSLARLDGEGSVRVGDAVRLSASFPFGMDSARLAGLDRTAVMRALAPSDDHVSISDGGVLDNTGTGTIRELLTGLLEAVDRGTPGAAEVVAVLRKRGVLVVEIDSGAKPITGGGLVSRMFGPVQQSGTVLAQAAYTAERKAVLLRRSALERTGLDVYWATFSYCPRTDGEEVMTAWGLGPGDQINLMDQYFSKTLTGECARREIPWAEATDTDAPSPLGSVDAAFQPNDPKPGEALAYLPADASPTSPDVARVLLSTVDHAVLSGQVGLAMQAASRFEGEARSNEAVTLAMMAPGLSRAGTGRVHTIDADDTRTGWFAAARFTETAVDPTLDWSVLWSDSSGGLEVYRGREVALARPVLLHASGPDDAFAPGGVVALADRLTHLTVTDVKSETVAGRTTWYLAVQWGGAVAQPTPCTDLSYTLRVCAQSRSRAETLVRYLVDNGHIRRACITEVEVPDEGRLPRAQRSDAIEAIEAITGDSLAIREWASRALAEHMAVEGVAEAGAGGIGVRLCRPGG